MILIEIVFNLEVTANENLTNDPRFGFSKWIFKLIFWKFDASKSSGSVNLLNFPLISLVKVNLPE